MLILLDIFKYQNKKYLEFYFSQLQTVNEREHFTNNFSDKSILNSIAEITTLFEKYPFYDSNIYDAFQSPSVFKTITKWQKKYYLSIYKEYKYSFINRNNEKLIHLYESLQLNSSFQYLCDLFNKLSDGNEDKDLHSKSIKSLLTFYDYKMYDQFITKEASYSQNNLIKFTDILNSGGSVFEILDNKEKIQIEKSLNFLLSNLD